MRAGKLIMGIFLAAGIALGARPAYAHAFGERYDLPIPLNYFMIGGAAAVALSFVVIGLFVQRRPSESGEFGYPRYNLLNVSWLRAVFTSRVFLGAVRLAAVLLFGLTVATALFGANRALDNFSPVFVWIIWWVGMGYVSSLLGNLWMLVNPWKISFEWA
ncbi:MAG: hypothetical protein L0177_06455, partial [Chloroflexi bacterium]|nr:hypothetical protein [Chloroflexota bacterium]